MIQSVFADGPVALTEVQEYAYEAALVAAAIQGLADVVLATDSSLYVPEIPPYLQGRVSIIVAILA